MIDHQPPNSQSGRTIALIASLLLHGVVVIVLGLNVASKQGHESAPLMVSLVTSIPKADRDVVANKPGAIEKIQRPVLKTEIDKGLAEPERDVRIVASVSEKTKSLSPVADVVVTSLISGLEERDSLEEVRILENMIQKDKVIKVVEPSVAGMNDSQSSILNPQLTSAVLAFVGDPASLGITMEEILDDSFLKAEVITFPEPVYPTLSRRRGEEGRVVIRVTISEEGEVQRAELHTSSSYPRLDRAALAEVNMAQFSPALEYGRPVESERIVAYRFELEGR